MIICLKVCFWDIWETTWHISMSCHVIIRTCTHTQTVWSPSSHKYFNSLNCLFVCSSSSIIHYPSCLLLWSLGALPSFLLNTKEKEKEKERNESCSSSQKHFKNKKKTFSVSVSVFFFPYHVQQIFLFYFFVLLVLPLLCLLFFHLPEGLLIDGAPPLVVRSDLFSQSILQQPNLCTHFIILPRPRIFIIKYIIYVWWQKDVKGRSLKCCETFPFFFFFCYLLSLCHL